MTEHDLLDAIGDIDPAYLEEAKSKPTVSKKKWIAFSSLAACLLLFFSLGYRHYWLVYESPDYTSEAYEECCVYYLKDHALYYEITGVCGGDAEMFEIWKEKNGITGQSGLQNIVLSPLEDGVCDVFVTIPASMAVYFENEDGAWRLEALKKTIGSYRDIVINSFELIYV